MTEFLAMLALALSPLVTFVAGLSTAVFVCALSIPTLLGLLVVHRFGTEQNRYRSDSDGVNLLSFFLLIAFVSFFVYCRYSEPITAAMIGWSVLAYIGAGIVTMVIGWCIYLFQVRDNCQAVLAKADAEAVRLQSLWLDRMLEHQTYSTHEKFIVDTITKHARLDADVTIDLYLKDQEIFDEEFMREFSKFLKENAMREPGLRSCGGQYDITNDYHRCLMLRFQLQKADYKFAQEDYNLIYDAAKAAVVASELQNIAMVDIKYSEDVRNACDVGNANNYVSQVRMQDVIDLIQSRATYRTVLKSVLPPKFSNLKAQILDDFINWPIALLDGFFGKLIQRVATLIVDSFKLTFDQISKSIFKDVI